MSQQASKMIDQSGNYSSSKYARYKVLPPWEINDLTVFSLQIKHGIFEGRCNSM